MPTTEPTAAARKTAMQLSAERGEAIRAVILAYVRQCQANGADPGNLKDIAAATGMTYAVVKNHMRRLAEDGLVNYQSHKHKPKPPRPTAFSLRVQQQLLDYLNDCLAHGVEPGNQAGIAQQLGVTQGTVSTYMTRMRREGLIDYKPSICNWQRTLTVSGTAVSPGRFCVRCGIQCRHLDRAGYCPCCQFETAYGEVYTYWNTHGIRVRVEGMAEPEEPQQRDRGIPVPDWPTRGALVVQEVRL